MTAVPPARAQVAALIRLRWGMVRRRRVRWTLLVLLVTGMLLLALAAGAGQGLPSRLVGESLAVLPTVLLGFLLLCVVAPIAAGGGFELVPADQLSAFPVRHRTVMAVSVLLAPLNVAWFVLLLTVVATTAAALGGAGVPWGALATLACYVAAATVLGHAIAWVVVGLRRRRAGRLLVWGVLAGLLAAAAVVITTGRVEAALDLLPTRPVVASMSAWSSGDVGGGVTGLLALVVLVAVAWGLGVVACGWALRRTGDLAGTDPAARPVRRRRDDADLDALLRSSERNGVLRSAPLRRGVAVIVVMPAAAALLAGLPWDSLVLLPPLVASGAGLLYGVNAFALEGSGALFLAAAPLAHRRWLVAKARVVLEVVLLAVVAAAAAGAARAGVPSLLGVAAVACSALCCSVLVTTTCMHLSVTRPHRAELRGPRDTPAPPGTMALYSVRLATTTTLVGLVFSLGSLTGSWWAVLLMTGAVAMLAARSWLVTRRRWDDPVLRARVVATVAAG